MDIGNFIGHLLLCIVSCACWVFIHVSTKYDLIAFGYKKTAHLKKAQKKHANSSRMRKIFLVELMNNVADHYLICGLCWLFNAIAITLGPLVSLVCFVLVCANNFASRYIVLMLKIPLGALTFAVLFFFIPALLFLPDFRKMYKM